MMRSLLFVLVLTLAGMQPALLHAAAAPSNREVARYAKQLLTDSYNADGPGAAVLVARGDEVLFRDARGEQDIARSKLLSPEALFEIGSMTKQFTAAGILKLVEAGKISLDDPLSKYVKDYPKGDKITLRELLNHTAGLKDLTEISGWASAPARRQDMTTAQLIDSFKNEKPEFAPGTDWRYDNSGYVLLGAVIEAATGKPWHQYLKQVLLQPLGLTHTGFGADPQWAARLVHGYSLSEGKAVPAQQLSLTQAHAAGSLVSNVDDLLQWNRALHEGRVLKPSSYQQMVTPTGKAVNQQYGFGLFHQTLRGVEMLQHGGSIFGFNSYLLYLPKSKLTVAVLNNADGEISRSNDAETVARRLAAYAIGKPYPDRSAIAVDAVTLKAYEGVYRIDNNAARVVRVVNGKLTSQRTGGERYELIPIAKDVFLYDGLLSRLTFMRSDAGLVTGMRYFPDDEGEGQVALRTGDSLPPSLIAVALPRAALERVVGTYSANGMQLRVFLEGENLQAQLGAQPAAQLFSASPDKFFLTGVDATLDFAPALGAPQSVALRQGNDVIEFKRKP